MGSFGFRGREGKAMPSPECQESRPLPPLQGMGWGKIEKGLEGGRRLTGSTT